MKLNENILSVREADEYDLENIVNYFLNADEDFLLKIGADVGKLPGREEWLELLLYEHGQTLQSKKFYYIIWLFNGVAVGHSNINKIIFGEEAYMHLHIWNTARRQKGIGAKFIEMTLPYYFQKFKLKNLYCEPYALNIAPNKTLSKAGFDFIKQYETIPGWLNFLQMVNRWCMDDKRFTLLYG